MEDDEEAHQSTYACSKIPKLLLIYAEPCGEHRRCHGTVSSHGDGLCLTVYGWNRFVGRNLSASEGACEAQPRGFVGCWLLGEGQEKNIVCRVRTYVRKEQPQSFSSRVSRIPLESDQGP